MPRSKIILIAVVVTVSLLLAVASLSLGRAHAQAPPGIEDELILATPVAETLTDPALADRNLLAKLDSPQAVMDRDPRPSLFCDDC